MSTVTLAAEYGTRIRVNTPHGEVVIDVGPELLDDIKDGVLLRVRSCGRNYRTVTSRNLEGPETRDGRDLFDSESVYSL